MARPVGWESSTHSPFRRTGLAQTGIRQGVPSGSTQSVHHLSSWANARPNSMASTRNRCKHVFIHNSELLHRVVNTDRLLRQAKVLAESRISHCGYARGAVAGEVDGHTVRFLVIQG